MFDAGAGVSKHKLWLAARTVYGSMIGPPGTGSENDATEISEAGSHTDITSLPMA